MSRPELSVIIPARNEERLIADTIEHVLAACRHFADCVGAEGGSWSLRPEVVEPWEVIVVDNGSTDRTLEILKRYQQAKQIQVVAQSTPGAARARNLGRSHSKGRTLVFVDADTMIPPTALHRIAEHCRDREFRAGITLLANLDGGLRSRCWWGFWNLVRHLPLSKAKAMPALMFCTVSAFDRHGPFDEEVAIGEEWPILAGLYRHAPEAVVYDRSIVARSSSRRMDQLPFGYSRTFAKYVWAILHKSGRIHYRDTIR